MKKNIYKIYFTLTYDCGGVISHVTGCHTTVPAFTREEAVSLFKNRIRIGSQHITDGYQINEVKLIELT